MSKTLRELKQEAQRRLEAGNRDSALKLYRLVLEAVPLDFNLRFEIADILNSAGDRKCVAIYQTIALHDIKSGNPLRALVAIKLLELLGINTTALIDILTKTYCLNSTRLGRGIKPAPTNYDLPLRDDLNLDYEMPADEVIDGLAKMAAYGDNIKNYPEVVPPIAIFSTLPEPAFKKLATLLKLKRFKKGEIIIKEGEPGKEVYFVANGEVLITRQIEKNGQIENRQLARLGPGSLFGEMALLSSEPRGASVIADGAVDVFELKNDLITALAKEMPTVAASMAKFTQERLISNLLATNPLFAPFDSESKKQLLSRFTGHEVPAGTIFIEQGKPGKGIYLILQGEAEVLKWDKTKYINVATLGPGDVAGEISLITEEPATATVRTLKPSTLLFLARELFYPLIKAVPELLTHFAKLANTRLEDTESKLKQDITEILSEDDIILI
jgi:CRP-like cAMP-binding protein